jgi:hypothetical protein
VAGGFVIAEEDLRLRGGGEVLGARQSACLLKRQRGAPYRKLQFRPAAAASFTKL